MPEIPKEAVSAALAAMARELATRPFDPFFKGDEALCRAALEAALPHLQPTRRPRMTCGVCGKNVVRRDNGRPVNHYALNHDPQFTCKGDMYSRCRGGCPCRKHR